MPGEGKYTNYAPKQSPFDKGDGKGVSDRNALLSLFKVPVDANNALITTRETVTAVANAKLLPDTSESGQLGNSDFPNGVKLNFGETPQVSAGPFLNGMNETDRDKGLGKVVGGPQNAYSPNLLSPDPSGNGLIDPIKPLVKLKEDGSIDNNSNEVNPSTTAKEIAGAVKLGASLTLGKHK